MSQYHKLYTPEDSAVVFIDVLRRRHRDPQAGEPGHERPRGSQVLAQSRHNFYPKFLSTPVFRVGASPNYKGKQELGLGFCLQQ